jgi:TusE/DsrC/DsvC family sulfur relay protein
MMRKTYGQTTIEVNEDGYLLDKSQWDRQVAEALAKEMGITLTDEHWQIIDYLRRQYEEDIEMTIRKLGMSGLADIKELYELFPVSPLKIASKIAGLPLPKTCV